MTGIKVLKILLVVSLLSVWISCSEEKENGFCRDCMVIEKEENFIPLTVGWINYSEDLNRYIIRMPSYNISYDYCPCEFPSGFKIEENQTVKFSGFATESPIYKTDFSEITCIKLDTIFYHTD
jgi:hypothetical protein